MGQLTPDECLSAAWTYLAPQRVQIPELPHGGFARGFWPDVARVAMAMFEQQSATPSLNFRPCKCEFGDAPEIRIVSKGLRGLDLGKLEITL